MNAQGYAFTYVSRFTGKLCVCIATLHSENRKTGPMVQVWYESAYESPLDADPRNVCGECQGARDRKGWCYVTLCQAPLIVWRAWQRGAYESVADWHEMAQALPPQAPIRFGAHGDPLSCDLEHLEVLAYGRGWTGYTHSWDTEGAERARWYLMASVESRSDAIRARRQGWRTFRIVRPGTGRPCASERWCRALRGTVCFTCTACRGGLGHSFVIPAHGARKARVFQEA